MKALFMGLLFALTLTVSFGQAPCKCTYPLKENTCWTTGPKGGKFCINKNGTKTYQSSVKSKTTAQAAPKPATPKPAVPKTTKTAKDL